MEGPRDLIQNEDIVDLEDLAFMDNDPFAAFNPINPEEFPEENKEDVKSTAKSSLMKILGGGS